MFAALGREPAIEYIDMTAAIRDSYQYFIQAETENLRHAGYNAAFTPLEDAVRHTRRLISIGPIATGDQAPSPSPTGLAARRLNNAATA